MRVSQQVFTAQRTGETRYAVPEGTATWMKELKASLPIPACNGTDSPNSKLLWKEQPHPMQPQHLLLAAVVHSVFDTIKSERSPNGPGRRREKEVEGERERSHQG